MLSLTYSKVERPCIAQVCTVDMMVSQNRMPRPERVKYDNLRLITQPRSACSAALFVGGTSGLRENVHSAGHILIRFAQVLAVRLHWVWAVACSNCARMRFCNQLKCWAPLS